MATINDIDPGNIPAHVAIIMDGNGRWAQQRMERRLYGHQHAIEAVRQAVEAAAECGVKVLTLYTFSTENWNRPQEEVDGLMALLIKAVREETTTLMKNDIRLGTIGDSKRIPHDSLVELQRCIADTAGNSRMLLQLALSYSGRWELGEALKSAVADALSGNLAPSAIDAETLRRYLSTADNPDPDLLIRTGGECRVSNFLLWQMAYTELYFSDILWPDFRKGDFYDALAWFQQRQRRFGKTAEQIINSKT
ncbi:MAG: isoprenyl transferase [Bacteroidales bacterium]|nr:isoprenyl transferase [Bacteroidales bacterium]